MKRTFLTLSFCLFCACIAFGQEKVKSNKELKLNFSILMPDAQGWADFVSPVFILEKNAHTRHEFELSSFGFSKRREKERDRQGQEYLIRRADHGLGLRYQYTRSFLPDARLSPFIGGSFQTRWSYLSFASERRPSFRHLHHSNVNMVELVPGLRWRITERLGIDYAVGLNVLQHNFGYSRLHSHALGNQRYGSYSLQSHPLESFRNRLGLYIKL